MIKQHPPIEVRAGELKPALIGLGKVITAKVKTPVLQCVKVEAPNRSLLRLTATDLSVTLSINVPVKLDGKVEPFLMPFGQLRDQLRKTRASDGIQLKARKLPFSVDEFPKPPVFRAAPIPLEDEMVTSLLQAFACASQDETRYVLRGAYLDTSGKGAKSHRIVATDGRQLYASNSLHLLQIKAPVILPDHKLWQWKPLAGSRPWTLRISATGAAKNNNTPFRIDGPFWTVSGTCIEGNYPNYRQVIPPASDFKTLVELSDPMTAAIAGFIPRLPGEKLKDLPIGIRMEKGSVSLLARDCLQEPWQIYPVGRTKVIGPDVTVFANRDYVQRAMDFGLNDIGVIDDQSPLRFSRLHDLMIVMPLRITDPVRVKRSKNPTPIILRQPTPSPIPTSRRSTKPTTKRVSPRRRSIAKPTTKKVDKPDPIHEAETRIAEANQALLTAGKDLKSATGSLMTARKHRRNDQKELKGFRSLLKSIKRFTGGSN